MVVALHGCAEKRISGQHGLGIKPHMTPLPMGLFNGVAVKTLKAERRRSCDL